MKRSIAAVLISAGSIAAVSMTSVAAYADVPTVTDFASCNEEAREAVKAGSASPSTAAPTTKDQVRAEDARRDPAGVAGRTDATGKITRSPDPQIEGMDAEGAKDPAYQAAYRSCMRKKGF